MLEWNHQVGLGITPQEIRAQLPPCYSKEFDDCIQENRRAREAKTPPQPSAYCDQYYAIIQSAPDAEWNAALDLVPYCSGGTPTALKKSQPSILLPLGLIGLVAGAVAIVVNATGSRF